MKEPLMERQKDQIYDSETLLPSKLRWKKRHNKTPKKPFDDVQMLWFTHHQIKALHDMERAIKMAQMT